MAYALHVRDAVSLALRGSTQHLAEDVADRRYSVVACEARERRGGTRSRDDERRGAAALKYEREVARGRIGPGGQRVRTMLAVNVKASQACVLCQRVQCCATASRGTKRTHLPAAGGGSAAGSEADGKNL